MSTDTYNGWPNYETWVVKLWIDNEEDEQTHWLTEAHYCLGYAKPSYAGQTQKEAAKYKLAETLKAQYDDASEYIFPARLGSASVWHDLLGHALARVDWYSIAEELLEDADDEDADEVPT